MKKSKTIVITGASGGIGEACARKLASEGHDIVLAARREERLKTIVADIRATGGSAAYVIADVSVLAENQKVAQLAIDEFGSIDVWINNAGLMPSSEFIKGKVTEWDAMIDVNLKGTLYGFDAAIHHMRAQHSGQFINVASISAHISGPASGVYAATKFGVRAASEALRQEEAIAKSNIRVTMICPGAIDTDLPLTTTDPERKAGLEQFYENYAVPAERVASAILFAVSMPEDTTINEIILRPTTQVM